HDPPSADALLRGARPRAESALCGDELGGEFSNRVPCEPQFARGCLRSMASRCELHTDSGASCLRDRALWFKGDYMLAPREHNATERNHVELRNRVANDGESLLPNCPSGAPFIDLFFGTNWSISIVRVLGCRGAIFCGRKATPIEFRQ